MGTFLLNDLGEVLLELDSKVDFGMDLTLEVDELCEEAFLTSGDNKIKIGYIHPELVIPLKQNRYLFVVARNNQFYAINSRLCKVVFIQ
ncbi:MAG: hypothetical protein IKW39_01255 [Alphaproteobacteria bacterium]|nr:hypothetical protein [Alphaproteobacteria bacterium]